jgi:hypothetical protein
LKQNCKAQIDLQNGDEALLGVDCVEVLAPAIPIPVVLLLLLRRRSSAKFPGLFLARAEVGIEAFEGGTDDIVERRIPSPAHGVVGGGGVVVVAAAAAAAAAEGEGVGRGGIEWSSRWKFGDWEGQFVRGWGRYGSHSTTEIQRARELR